MVCPSSSRTGSVSVLAVTRYVARGIQERKVLRERKITFKNPAQLFLSNNTPFSASAKPFNCSSPQMALRGFLARRI